MAYTIRPARPEDKTAITAFADDTFEWGDYIIEAFDDWVADASGVVVVAVDADDTAIALSRLGLQSATEAWLQGVRVRRDWRRQGVASALTDHLGRWALENGCRVMRLAVEAENTAARSQFQDSGFRPVGDWVQATRSIGEASPVPAGNGGRRVPAEEQFVPAHSSETVPAFMSWSAGPLAKPTRGLFAVRSMWRRLAESDLERAARHEAFWIARPGWVVAARRGDQLEVAWLETREDDAYDSMRALVDLASKQEAEGIAVTIPAVGWLTSAARRIGCDLFPVTVYERPL